MFYGTLVLFAWLPFFESNIKSLVVIITAIYIHRTIHNGLLSALHNGIIRQKIYFISIASEVTRHHHPLLLPCIHNAGDWRGSSTGLITTHSSVQWSWFRMKISEQRLPFYQDYYVTVLQIGWFLSSVNCYA